MSFNNNQQQRVSESRWIPAALVCVFSCLLTAHPALSDPALPGGEGTRSDFTRNAFSHPLRGTALKDRRHFFSGNSFFKEAWVSAPASTLGRDGLGPTFNAVSCSSCHQLDGRGPAYTKNGNVHVSLLFRLSVLDATEQTWRPHPQYGEQLNPLAIDGVPAEAEVHVQFENLVGRYADGTEYNLRRPIFRFTNALFDPITAETTRVSPRVAPQLVGLGLIEAIPEQRIQANADPEDRDNDGISGRTNRVWNRTQQEYQLGRFGWKANQPTLRQQNAGAFLGDMGLTTSIFPEENCPSVQIECSHAPNGGTPEVNDRVLNRMTIYTRLLAVPKRRDMQNPLVLAGEKTFKQIGCASCHTPHFKTGVVEGFQNLSEQDIYPYSDFLLHDMGPELADHRPDGLATGREWQTPPLWGIGLFETVNGHQNLLHDGRARNVEEAILWHGGEARSARERFKNLPHKRRQQVISFINSL